jgi:hypothetical protein
MTKFPYPVVFLGCVMSALALLTSNANADNAIGTSFAYRPTAPRAADCQNIPAGRDPLFEACATADELVIKHRSGVKWQVHRQEFISHVRSMSSELLRSYGVAQHLFRQPLIFLWIVQNNVGPTEETGFMISVHGDFGGFAAPIEFTNQNQQFATTAILGPEGLSAKHIGYVVGEVMLETSETVPRSRVQGFVEQLGGRLSSSTQRSQSRWRIQVSPFSEIGFCSTAISDMTRPAEISACRLVPKFTSGVTLMEPAFDLGILGL